MTDMVPDGTEEYARKGIVVALVIVGIYVGLRFYWSVVEFIQVWAPREFADLLEAFFNLAVLLLISAALIRQLRTADEGDETDEVEEKKEGSTGE